MKLEICFLFINNYILKRVFLAKNKINYKFILYNSIKLFYFNFLFN